MDGVNGVNVNFIMITITMGVARALNGDETTAAITTITVFSRRHVPFSAQVSHHSFYFLITKSTHLKMLF